jgi:transcriptional regulator with XRE-family HTH domain
MSINIFNDELDDVFSDLQKDPEFQEALAELDPGYQIADHRLSKGLTQSELAKLAGTSQSSIARLENGSSPPSLSFLRRVAKAMGVYVQVSLVSESEIGGREAEKDFDNTLDLVEILHQDFLDDICQQRFSKAVNKLNHIRRVLSDCKSSKITELLADIFQREAEMVNALSSSVNEKDAKLGNITAGLINLINDINEEQIKEIHSTRQESLIESWMGRQQHLDEEVYLTID